MMTHRRGIALVLALLGTGLFAADALAQETLRIGVVNTAKVFADMKETKALGERLEADRKKFLDEDKQKKDELENLKNTLAGLKRDSDQYRQTQEQYFEAAVRYEAWTKMVQARVQREQKNQIRTLFEKIEAAVQEVARSKQLDLVLSLQRPDIPENIDPMPVDELRNRINQRNILFAGPRVNIDADVQQVLDSKFHAPGGAAGGGR